MTTMQFSYSPYGAECKTIFDFKVPRAGSEDSDTVPPPISTDVYCHARDYVEVLGRIQQSYILGAVCTAMAPLCLTGLTGVTWL